MGLEMNFETVSKSETLFARVPLHTPNLHLCSGKPGTGKTVLLFSLADRIHQKTEKPVYVAKSERDRNVRDLAPKMPKHINSFTGFEYPVDSIILVDDAHRLLHARRFQSDVNIWLDTLHGTLRHDNIDFLYDTQTVSSIDRNNIIRSDYRWYKSPYTKELELGRPEVRTELETAYNADLDIKEVYLFSESYTGKVTDIPKPGYWTDELSTMHRRQQPMWRRLW